MILSPKLLTELINKMKEQLPESEFVQSSRSYMLELSLTSWEACEGILVANGYSHASCQKCGLATSSKRFWQVHSPEFCDIFKITRTEKNPSPDIDEIVQKLDLRSDWRDRHSRITGAGSSEKIIQEAREKFDEFNTNKKGASEMKLDLDEMEKLIDWFSKKFHPNHATMTDKRKKELKHELLARLDQNNDKMISWEEFVLFYAVTCSFNGSTSESSRVGKVQRCCATPLLYGSVHLCCSIAQCISAALLLCTSLLSCRKRIRT